MDANSEKPHALLWLDLETTGLDPQTDHILEFACRLTAFDYPWKPIFAYSSTVGGPGREMLLAGECNAVIRDMHSASGLAAALSAGADSASIWEVQRDLMHMIEKWPTVKKERVMLAGNSVHFDLEFVRRHLPRLAEKLSHRTFDASVIYAFCRSLGMAPVHRSEGSAHRAKDDLTAAMTLACTCRDWLMDNEPRNVGMM